MWPFTRKKPDLRPAKKLSLISVRDYPKEAYSAYWEIGITAEAPFRWFVRLYAFADGALLDEVVGVEDTEHEARRVSQKWVLERIEMYRRRTV